MQAQRFADVRTLDAGDVADAIVYVVTIPWHVAITEVLIRPTEQATRALGRSPVLYAGYLPTTRGSPREART